jgi:HSP20 family protein
MGVDRNRRRSGVGLQFARRHRARFGDFPSIADGEAIPPDPGGIVNKLAVQRQSRPLLPELSHLVTGLPAFAGLRPFFENHLLRLEDETREGIYEVRAELPGVDPVEDVEVTVRDGRLTIKALRTRATESNGLSEFSYGSSSRTVPLPAGADEDEISATYDRGILTVSVPMSDAETAEKKVEVYEIAPLDEDEDDDFDDAADDEDDEDDEDDVPVDQPQAEDQPQHDQLA